MKIGFGKEGLTLNSQKFNPLNLSVGNHGIESDLSINNLNINPLEILTGIVAAKYEGASKLDQIKALKTAAQSMVKK